MARYTVEIKEYGKQIYLQDSEEFIAIHFNESVMPLLLVGKSNIVDEMHEMIKQINRLDKTIEVKETP